LRQAQVRFISSAKILSTTHRRTETIEQHGPFASPCLNSRLGALRSPSLREFPHFIHDFTYLLANPLCGLPFQPIQLQLFYRPQHSSDHLCRAIRSVLSAGQRAVWTELSDELLPSKR